MAGRVRLEVIVVLGMVALFATLLLGALRDAQREVERTLVDTELMTLRTELQLAVASMINRGNQSRLSAWVGRNPLELAGRPALTAAKDVEGRSLGHEWRWNGDTRELVYEYGEGAQVRLSIAAAGPQVTGWGLGGGLTLVARRSDERRQ